MNVAINGPLQELIFDARLDLEHLRIIFEHLVEVVLGVELLDSLHGEGPSPHSLFSGCGICGKITHDIPPFPLSDSEW